MTFIASVIAKDGVAIIADSLVTTEQPIIEWDDFNDLVESKTTGEDGEDVTFTKEDVSGLFHSKASHTKNYSEKLFKVDDYTAITITGAASLNEKIIAKLIANFIELKDWGQETIETKIEEFKNFLEEQTKEHLSKFPYTNSITFIVTHYSKNDEKTIITSVIVNRATKSDLSKEGFVFITVRNEPDYKRVVCDGQNRISFKILFGNIYGIMLGFIRDLATLIATKCNGDEALLPDKGDQYYIDLLLKEQIIAKAIFDDMEMLKISLLSLQQAVDLAALLMKIEIDFQKYTQNIPTVGGVIKIAVIDRNGFRYIEGEKIVPPGIF